jgi:hypothetical protein
MATYNEQVLRWWTEWEQTPSGEFGNPDDFVDWALENKRLAPRPQDIRKILRKQVTTVLRQALRLDEFGTTYRAKQCVTLFDTGLPTRRWFDTDTGGTSNLRQKAVHQRREAVANDVYRAMCDVEHMNRKFPEDPQLNFVLDFHEDYAERKAAEDLNLDKDDEDAA